MRTMNGLLTMVVFAMGGVGCGDIPPWIIEYNDRLHLPVGARSVACADLNATPNLTCSVAEQIVTPDPLTCTGGGCQSQTIPAYSFTEKVSFQGGTSANGVDYCVATPQLAPGAVSQLGRDVNLAAAYSLGGGTPITVKLLRNGSPWTVANCYLSN